MVLTISPEKPSLETLPDPPDLEPSLPTLADDGDCLRDELWYLIDSHSVLWTLPPSSRWPHKVPEEFAITPKIEVPSWEMSLAVKSMGCYGTRERHPSCIHLQRATIFVSENKRLLGRPDSSSASFSIFQIR
jgi:hypothetical protein